MAAEKWGAGKVYGRDEVVRGIQRRADEYSARVVQDVLDMMNDYEVDLYRVLLAVGKRYGLDTAYDIMSETVVEKRLMWLEQAMGSLDLQGSGDLEKGFDLLITYFKPADGEMPVTERSDTQIVFRQKVFIRAIPHTCKVLDLDIIEVQNKIYAKATDLMFKRLGLAVRHVYIDYQDGWYTEKVEKIK